MTFTLWRKLLRDIRVPLLVVALLLLGFECLWVQVTKRVTTEVSPLFRSIAGRLGMDEDVFQNYLFGGPGKIIQSMVGGEGVRFNDPQNLLVIGFLHPLAQVILCIWAVGRAGGAIAGEIDRGTMELLLAQPIRRSRVVLAHLAVDLTVIPVLCLSMFAGTLLGAYLAGPFTVNPSTFKLFHFNVPIEAQTLHIDTHAMVRGLPNVAVLVFAISGYTIWLSSRGRFRNWVIAQAVLITLIMFLVNVLGQIWEDIGFLRPFTVFYYYQPQQAVLHDRWTVDPGAAWGTGPLVSLNVLAVLLVVGAVGYLLALRKFCTRDLPAPL